LIGFRQSFAGAEFPASAAGRSWAAGKRLERYCCLNGRGSRPGVQPAWSVGKITWRCDSGQGKTEDFKSGLIRPARKGEQATGGAGGAVRFVVRVVGARPRRLDVSACIGAESRLRDRRYRQRKLGEGDEENRRPQ